MDFETIIQNMWVQTAAALLPVVLLAVILLFARKIYKKGAFILLTAFTVAAFSYSTYAGITEIASSQSDEDAAASNPTVSVPDKDEFEDAVYAFLNAGDTESASRLVTEYADAYGYDDVCSLMTARIAVYKDDYGAALGIYRKLYGEELPTEAQAVEKIIRYLSTDTVLEAELADAGAEPTISDAEKDEAEVLLAGGIDNLMHEAIAGEGHDDSLTEGVNWVVEANKLYNSSIYSGSFNTDALASMAESMKELPQRKLLNKLVVYREARLKIRLLNGDFEGVVDDLDEYAGYVEYMVALDLYLNGHTEKRPLMRALGINRVDGVGDVVDQLKKIRDEKGDDLEREELSKLEDQIDRLNTYKSNELLYSIESKLSREAEDQRNYKDASKIYMSLAKLSDESGNDIERNKYFSDALVTSPSSDDGAYSEAMDMLAGTISDDADSEAVKDVPLWAKQAMENSYIVKGTGEIVRAPEKEQEQIEALEDYTVKAGAAVTINGIDASKFNEVVVKVQLSDEFLSERELINLVRLNDCNYEITGYDIEKMEYEKANIILCCDNSGSMSGSVGSLQNAVTKFIESSNEKETLGFYTFDSSIIQALPLGTATPEALSTAVGAMSSFGGTNIFGTLNDILTDVQPDSEANQVIILMTDGQDGSSHSADEIDSTIGALALKKGYIVYVLGMGGGIDADYLTAIASSTGGQFIYSPSESQLDSLYTFIHGTLKNQYKITFTATDTLTTSDRKLTVSLDERNVSDTRYYSLTEEDEKTATTSFDRDVAVFGLRTRLIYKQKNITDIDIVGKGFKPGDSMSVELHGSRSYTLRAKYIDETSFRISVPADIAPGCYDVEVFLNSRRAIFLNELTVAEGEPDEVIFGGYHFKALNVTDFGDRILLSGFVTMNDWLHFVGDITLVGQLDDAEMTLVDDDGSYIDYSASTSATGYAKMLAKHNIPQVILPIGSLTIYNSASSDEEYPTAPQTQPILTLADLFRLYYPILRLYPDRITLEIDKGDTSLPFQDFFVSPTSKDDSSPYSVSFNCIGTLSAQNISIRGSVKSSVSDGDATTLMKILDAKGAVKKTAAEFEFDTLKNEYDIEINVNISKFVIDTYVGLGLGWKDGKLNSVKLHYDHDYTKIIDGIPITFSDFMLGLDGISEKIPDQKYEEVSALAVVGSMQIDAAKASAIVPKLKKYVGDAALLTIPEAQFKLRFNHFSVEASASLEVLNCFTIGTIEVKLGHFEYQNALLGLDAEEVTGVYLSTKKGIEWDSHNIKAEISGKGEGTINNRFVGLTYKGVASLELNWWIFEKTVHTDGQALIGFYTDYSGNHQFTIRTSYVDKNGKRRGAIFYISSSGKMDYDLHYKY